MQLGWFKQAWLHMQKYWRSVLCLIPKLSVFVQLHTWLMNKIYNNHPNLVQLLEELMEITYMLLMYWTILIWKKLLFVCKTLMQRLKIGLLIPLRSGAKPKTLATLFCLGTLLEGMSLQNMLSRWLVFIELWIFCIMYMGTYILLMIDKCIALVASWACSAVDSGRTSWIYIRDWTYVRAAYPV